MITPKGKRRREAVSYEAIFFGSFRRFSVVFVRLFVCFFFFFGGVGGTGRNHYFRVLCKSVLSSPCIHRNQPRKNTRQTEEEMGRQHRVPEGSGGQRKMEETGCEVICDAPTALSVR